MSKILSAADVQSRLEDMCDVDGLDKAKKAREVYGVMQTISTQNAALRAEVERLKKALGYITDISEANADRAIGEMKRIAHEALEVKCPFCGSPRGWKCVALSGWMSRWTKRSKPHAARVRAAEREERGKEKGNGA